MIRLHKFNLSLVLLLITSLGCPGFAFNSFLVQKCKEMHGQIVNHWTCPYSGDERNDMHCVIRDNESRPMYFNGCSYSYGNYGEVFFQACVYHDLCYHHEPVSSGLKKEDCDSRFYNNMFAICDRRPKDTGCADAARWFYSAVASFGGTPWICSKEKANYPHAYVAFALSRRQ